MRKSLDFPSISYTRKELHTVPTVGTAKVKRVYISQPNGVAGQTLVVLYLFNEFGTSLTRPPLVFAFFVCFVDYLYLGGMGLSSVFILGRATAFAALLLFFFSLVSSL